MKKRRARNSSRRVAWDTENGVDSAETQEESKHKGTLHSALFRLLSKDDWTGGCGSAEEMDASHRRTLLFIASGAIAALWAYFMYAPPV